MRMFDDFLRPVKQEMSIHNIAHPGRITDANLLIQWTVDYYWTI